MPLDRATALRTVIAFQQPIDAALEALRSYGWDSETEFATVTVADVRSVLERYVTGSLTGVDVEHWADLIEGRDDVGFEEASKEALAGIVSRLANPALGDKLSLEAARSLIDRL